MTVNPNSLLTRFRIFLAQRLQVRPSPGEGWCMHCILNNSRTMVINADSIRNHAQAHKDSAPGGFMDIQITRDVTPPDTL